MHDVGDMELLREYDRQGSEAAFAALVQRHVSLVYSAALRHVGIAAHAEEITQAVFVILARKAASLRPDTILESWLYETTRLTALSFRRGERRRQFREQEAYMQSTLQESAAALTWNQLAPLLDEAMARLGKKDRDAVLLRFFKNKNLREVAAALKVNETAAQRRVHRAVGKLRAFFTKRGIILPAVVLTAAISANSVQAAPVELAKAVTAMAIAKGVAASASTLTLIKGALKIMAWTQVKTAVVVGVGVLLVTGTTTVMVKHINESDPDAWETESINTNMASVLKKVPPLVEILPTKFPKSTGWRFIGGNLDGHLAGVGATLRDIMYSGYTGDFQLDRLILPDNLPTNKYDYIVNLPVGASQALQEKIQDQFGFAPKVEIRETNVYLLQVAVPNARFLIPHKGPPNKVSLRQLVRPLTFQWSDMAMSDLARFLEDYLGVPVIDGTKLSGNFDVTLKLKINEMSIDWKDHTIEDFRPALLNQLGLEMVSTNMPVKMLVVEKVK